MNIHQLTQKPLLGWNSYDCFGCAATEQDLFDNLEAFVKKLKPYGYEYFVVDNGWFGEYNIEPGQKYSRDTHASDINLDEYGRYKPSKCNFPNGLLPIIEESHKHGVKFGVHLMRGVARKAVELKLPILGTNYTCADIANINDTCPWCAYNYGVNMSKPGAQEFYNSILKQFAEWGIDFVKVDDVTAFPDEINAIVKAIEQCGRSIVLSLSPGGQSTTDRMDTYMKANMLRVTHDIWDEQKGIDQAFFAWEKFGHFKKAGFWIDMDMIPFGHLMCWRPNTGRESDYVMELSGKGVERMSKFSQAQKQTFITIRALSASPLFMGGNLVSSDEYSFELITNEHMLECNQNGIIGEKIYSELLIDIWKTPQKNDQKHGWLGVFNRNPHKVTTKLRMRDLELANDLYKTLFDIWNNKNIDILSNEIELGIESNGVIFIKY